MRDFILNCVEYLELQKPVELRVIAPANEAEFAAEYEPRFSDKGKLKKHIIWVYLYRGETRLFETLVAHELIHAWQQENEYEDIHGESFRIAASNMQYYLREYCNIELPDIYDSEIDEN